MWLMLGSAMYWTVGEGLSTQDGEASSGGDSITRRRIGVSWKLVKQPLALGLKL